MAAREVFFGFHEAPVRCPPTYKYVPFKPGTAWEPVTRRAAPGGEGGGAAAGAASGKPAAIAEEDEGADEGSEADDERVGVGGAAASQRADDACAAAAAAAAAAEQAEADGREGEGQQTGGSPDWVTVQHLPQTSTADGWQAREPLSDPASDGASEAGLAHGGRSTPSAPPHPEILSLAAATFDTGRRDAPESTIGGETTCIVCFTRPKTHAALPCGHQCACAPCSARLRACPYCRTPAERWWHVRVV